jgi:pimeloyl-ACP methyl ester carboxylesterase
MDKPYWFDRALNTPSEDGYVTVDGVDIHYVTWGEVGKPGVVLVHGSNAHLEWWRFVAPFLADQFRVVALDSSGNGDSGWRARYSGEVLAKEVWEVCQAAQLGPRPFVVGHSFGGFVVLETGHRYGKDLGGIVFMDFTTAPPEQYVEWGLRAEREGVQPGRARPVPLHARAARHPRLRARLHRRQGPAPGGRRLDLEVRPGAVRPPGDGHRPARQVRRHGLPQRGDPGRG